MGEGREAVDHYDKLAKHAEEQVQFWAKKLRYWSMLVGMEATRHNIKKEKKAIKEE